MSFQNESQSKVFLNGEADSWFNRNFKTSTKKNIEKDLALNFLLSQNLENLNILEVGCADGWRLDQLIQNGCGKCVGVEPSGEAVKVGKERFRNIDLLVGSAEDIPVESNSFDVVVSGFCLYLCDRSELFKIAYEYDRVLKDGGMIVITDFISNTPYRNKYSHLDGVYSYKMDYSKMFLWNPIYELVYKINADMHSLSLHSNDKDSRITLTVLRKKVDIAYQRKPSFD